MRHTILSSLTRSSGNNRFAYRAYRLHGAIVDGVDDKPKKASFCHPSKLLHEEQRDPSFQTFPYPHTTRMIIAIALLLLFHTTVVVNALLFQPAVVSKSSLTQQAVDIFGEKFPFNQAPRKKGILDKYVALGVPKMDIDGTRYDKVGQGTGKRMTDITEKQAANTFNQIASLYGEARAIEMVKTFPICLAFDQSQFEDSFAAWSGIYGVEETKDM
jgi:hypothetical protein